MGQHKFVAAVVVIFLFGSMIPGCGSGVARYQPPDERPAYPVIGKLTVDGSTPSPPVKIVCVPKDESFKKPGYRLPNAVTDAEGKFQLSTFQMQDGAPEGQYVVTMTQPDVGFAGLGKKKKGGKDLLKGRYSKPNEVQFELTVEKKAVDMGTLALKTK